MLLVGLTGGVATGKSTVARLFQRCGAELIDADALAREVVQPGKPAWRDIVGRYGTAVLRPDRTLNRHALADLVFGHSRELAALNAIVHPRVARAQRRLVREIARKDPKAVVVYDVPLLFEAGLDARVDRIIVVSTDRRTQIKRLQQRNGLTGPAALRRIRSQWPLSEKKKRAHYVIDGTLPRLRLHRLVKVKQIYAELVRM
jgi:dephospho-CoA kinase